MLRVGRIRNRLKAFFVIARASGAACFALPACSSVSGAGPSAGDVVEDAGTAEVPRYELLGGIRAPVNETYVQLSRGPETVRVAMTRVASD